MKGVVLAGGYGSRLYPLTTVVSKQLLPVFDKPMIYYPISVLMLAGIRDILIITTTRDLEVFKRLLGSGDSFGVNFQYKVQDKPNGIADAIIVAEDFINEENFCLILGDNIFWGGAFSEHLRSAKLRASGATIFGYKVADPENFGVVNLDRAGSPVSIEEKPKRPKSSIAVTGLYFYDAKALQYAKNLSPSSRGELEITDINNLYLESGKLTVTELGRGYAWLDTGTHESMLAASSFVETIETRQGFKIACLEEIALQNGWLRAKEVLRQASALGDSSYTRYLRAICAGNSID